ncbi:MAG: PilZ domain-containing protein [Planctomycetota bacterium]
MAVTSGIPKLLKYAPARVVPAGSQPFASHVVSVPDDMRRLQLAAVDPSRADSLALGTMLQVEVEHGQKVVVFDSRVLPPEGHGVHELWIVRPRVPSAYRVVDARETLREPMVCTVVVSSVTDDQASVVRGQTVDLGGGGVRIRSKERTQDGAQVTVRLSLDEKAPAVRAVARVLDCVPIAGAPSRTNDALFESRLEFESLEDSVAAQVLRACFLHQIESRKRRLTGD